MSKMDWERGVLGSHRPLDALKHKSSFLSPPLGAAEIEKLPGLLRDLYLSPGLIEEHSIRFDA
jgi:hypothetical protein